MRTTETNSDRHVDNKALPDKRPIGNAYAGIWCGIVSFGTTQNSFGGGNRQALLCEGNAGGDIICLALSKLRSGPLSSPCEPPQPQSPLSNRHADIQSVDLWPLSTAFGIRNSTLLVIPRDCKKGHCSIYRQQRHSQPSLLILLQNRNERFSHECPCTGKDNVGGCCRFPTA
jgi:hypothetical protein